jgi:tetratricopeptide (TPR) repeat protein
VVFIIILSELVKRHVKLPWGWNQVYRIDDKKMGRLYALLGLLLLASFLNPYGIKGVIYPFTVIGQIAGKGNIIFQYVMELSRPFNRSNIFDLSHLIFYKLLIIASSLSFIFNRRRINIFDLTLWGFFLAISLAARRNISYFALIAGFVIINNIALAREGRTASSPEQKRSAWLTALRYLFIALIFFYTVKEARMFNNLVAGSRGTYALRSSLDGLAQARYPQKAVDFLLKHKFPKYMFNDFNSGSYLIGNAFPERQVFIDGRTELYGPEFFMDYVAAGQGDKETIERLIKRYDIKGFFLTISANDLQDGLLHILLYNPKWKLVYLDESAAIFLWDIPENSALIEKFRIDLKKWSPTAPDVLSAGSTAVYYPYANIYRARFFHRHGFHEAAAKEAVTVLGMMPGNAEAQYLISECYPENAEKYAQRGNDYLNAGNADEAIDDYNKAIELSPDIPDAYNNRAVAYFEKHEYNKSWEDVRKAESMGFKIHPDFIKQLKLLSGNEK